MSKIGLQLVYLLCGAALAGVLYCLWRGLLMRRPPDSCRLVIMLGDSPESAEYRLSSVAARLSADRLLAGMDVSVVYTGSDGGESRVCLLFCRDMGWDFFDPQ